MENHLSLRSARSYRLNPFVSAHSPLLWPRHCKAINNDFDLIFTFHSFHSAPKSIIPSNREAMNMSSLLWSLVLFRLFLSSFGWDRNWERNIFSNFPLKWIYLDLRSRKIIFAKKINKILQIIALRLQKDLAETKRAWNSS